MKEHRINRKEFIRHLAGAAAACSQVGALSAGCGRAGERRPVAVCGSGFMLDGKVHPLYSGSFHYWRHESPLWPKLFFQLSRLGLNTVCTSVPWGVHEVSKGKYDFGRHDKSKRLEAFLDLAGRRAFRVILRLGPQVDGQLTYAGFPARVLFDPEIAARTSVGTMEIRHTAGGQFPLPSYCCEKLYSELAMYFDALVPVIAGHLYHRGGPVIGIQIDNETGCFPRAGSPYGVDYHPQALELYHARLKERYAGEISRLNRVYGANYQSFELVEPPRRFLGETFANLPPYLDWTEFSEWRKTWSLSRISRMLAERGIIGVPVLHGIPRDCRPALAIPDTERAAGIDLEGINGCPGQGDYSLERRASRTAAGMSVYPCRLEFGGGEPLSISCCGVAGEDLEFRIMTALMHGVKGIDFYMAVERDRWLGSPVRRDGRPREELFDSYQRILRFLREVRFHEFEKQAEIIFLRNHGLDRLFYLMEQGKSRSLSIPDEVFGEAVDFGFHSSGETCRIWMQQVSELMLDVGFDWDYGSTRLDSGRLSHYRTAVLLAGDYFYLEELEALRAYLSGGGILIFGPGRPRLNQWMEIDREVENFFSGAAAAEYVPEDDQAGRPAADSLAPGEASSPGRLIHMQSPIEVIRLLKAFEVSMPFSRSNKSLDLTVYRCDRRCLLFVANSTDKAQKSDIFFPGGRRFRSIMGSGNFDGKGKITLELEPYRVGVWEVS
ncbi:MAG: beta-galactosidase [Candidatus Glassbacteria bacterium]|nr:beta-galactosidase [Candidatus Glassbacteria bacterium]